MVRPSSETGRLRKSNATEMHRHGNTTAKAAKRTETAMSSRSPQLHPHGSPYKGSWVAGAALGVEHYTHLSTWVVGRKDGPSLPSQL